MFQLSSELEIFNIWHAIFGISIFCLPNLVISIFCVSNFITLVFVKLNLGIYYFHIDRNAPCPPLPNFAQPLFPISPGCYSRPKRNHRQWLCKTLGGKKISALWSMWSMVNWPCSNLTCSWTFHFLSVPFPTKMAGILFCPAQSLINCSKCRVRN